MQSQSQTTQTIRPATPTAVGAATIVPTFTPNPPSATPTILPTPTPNPVVASTERASTLLNQLQQTNPETADDIHPQIVDVTDDGKPDIILTRATTALDTYRLLIYVQDSGDFQFAYDSGPRVEPVLWLVRDVNGDARTELLLRDNNDGHSPSDRFPTITVLQWNGSDFIPLHQEPITLINAEPQLVDNDGDGIFDIVLAHGGYVGTSAAGIQLSHTAIYRWDGKQYLLSERRPDPCTMWQCTLLRAEEALIHNQLRQARESYQEILTITSKQPQNDPIKIARAFIYFRLALIAGLQDDGATVSQVAQTAVDKLPEQFYTEVLTMFSTRYHATLDATQACLDVSEFVANNAHRDPLGPSNPTLRDHGYMLGFGWASGFLREGLCPL